MISARDAKKKTETTMSDKDNEQLQEIEKVIERGINEGVFEASFFFNPTSRVLKKLAEAGYEISVNRADRDPNWTVSWRSGLSSAPYYVER